MNELLEPSACGPATLRDGAQEDQHTHAMKPLKKKEQA